jgi:hypothetical protein
MMSEAFDSRDRSFRHSGAFRSKACRQSPRRRRCGQSRTAPQAWPGTRVAGRGRRHSRSRPAARLLVLAGGILGRRRAVLDRIALALEAGLDLVDRPARHELGQRKVDHHHAQQRGDHQTEAGAGYRRPRSLPVLLFQRALGLQRLGLFRRCTTRSLVRPAHRAASVSDVRTCRNRRPNVRLYHCGTQKPCDRSTRSSAFCAAVSSSGSWRHHHLDQPVDRRGFSAPSR